jgi:predicted NUDIX family NTP pyrophosphohydrolase
MIKLKDLLIERQNDSDDSAGILYFCYDEALLCLCENSGKWNIPKGHIHTGEEPLAGSVREFTEETQIVLNGIPELAETYKKDNGGTFYLYALKGRTKFNVRIDHEHTDWGYFNVNDLPEPIDKWVKEVIENEKGFTSELVS